MGRRNEIRIVSSTIYHAINSASSLSIRNLDLLSWTNEFWFGQKNVKKMAA